MNHHVYVESSRTASKPGREVNLGPAHQRPVYWVSGARRKDGASLIRALVRNCRNLPIDAKGDGQAHPRKALSTDAIVQGRIDS